MSRARGVVVDAGERTAIAQAGCLLSDVDRETQVHGLATVMGFVSNTGIAGLTLGGGFGYLTRRFGWTSDNVVAMNVVTASGEVVRASEQEHPDLFWGLRGGGGNFGVVTSFQYRLHDLGPTILAGPVAWAADDASAVLDMYQAVVAEAPPELTVVAILRPAPPAPWIPAEHHGKPIVVLVVCDSGPSTRPRSGSAPSPPSGRRSARSSSAARTCPCRACWTPPSRRAVATTGSPSTCRR